MIKRIAPYVYRILPLIGGIAIFYGCFEIVTRVLFNFQHMWINDFLLLIMVSILWLSSISLVKNRRETSIELIFSVLEGRKKLVLQMILDMVSFIGCLLLGFSGIKLAQSLMTFELAISTVLPVPQYVPVICFVVAMLGCSGVFLRRIVLFIKGREDD